MPGFPMSETRMFPDGVGVCPGLGPALGLVLGLSPSLALGLSKGFVFFRQKRFAFRRTAVLHITGDGETADAADPRPSSYG